MNSNSLGEGHSILSHRARRRGHNPTFMADPERNFLIAKVRAELDRLGLTDVSMDHWLASVTLKRTRRAKA